MVEKQIALFDVDKTIYREYIIFPLAKLQEENSLIPLGYYEQLQKDVEVYNETKDYETFARNAMSHWAIGLARTGKSYLEVLDHAGRFLRGPGDSFYPYFSRVAHMLEETYDIYLVTAEPQFVTQAIMNIFPITDAASSKFEVVNGVFTGEADVLASSQDKSRAIGSLLAGHILEKSFGFGDSTSDIDMLEKVNSRICIELGQDDKANQELLEYARDRRGWYMVKPADVEEKVRELLGFS